MTGHRQAGLTLIELLVGLTLLAAIAAATAGVVHTGVSNVERVDAGADRDNEMRLAHAFVRRHLESARPVRWRRDLRYVAAFEGTPQSVSFVAVMPAWPDAAGLYLVRLALTDGRLVMTRRLTSGETQRFDFRRTAERVVLAENAGGLRFAYFGRHRDDRPDQWHQEWIDRGAFPRLVRLKAGPDRDAGAGWPELTVPLMIDRQPR